MSGVGVGVTRFAKWPPPTASTSDGLVETCRLILTELLSAPVLTVLLVGVFVEAAPKNCGGKESKW
jgi:hypothetical protein